MKPVIRITDVKIQNLKNIRNGVFKTNSSLEKMDVADVIGLYGQNGSGKTAVVEAFSLLKRLLDSEMRLLPEVNEYLHYFNETKMDLYFEFVIQNRYGDFFVRYEVTLGKDDKRIFVMKERLSYRENLKRKRFKEIVSKDENELSVRNQDTHMMNERDRVTTLVANKMALKRYTSFIFLLNELNEVYDIYLSDVEMEILNNLKYDFESDFHVIKATNYGFLIANLIMPFSIHLEDARGEIPYEMRDNPLVPKEVFQHIEKVVEQINIVLNKIIPDLYIEINVLHEQKMDDGREGIRFEFLSKKQNIILPLRSESAGTLKIISILSTLIAVYNNPNACVIIDELDAGIFEFLLGEIIEVISENGKGQLIFTSHNLRVLEVLPVQNLWFSTANKDNRFIQLKGVKQTNNVRDMYIRAIQLGGQEEFIYSETNSFEMKKFFRRADKIND